MLNHNLEIITPIYLVQTEIEKIVNNRNKIKLDIKNIRKYKLNSPTNQFNNKNNHNYNKIFIKSNYNENQIFTKLNYNENNFVSGFKVDKKNEYYIKYIFDSFIRLHKIKEEKYIILKNSLFKIINDIKNNKICINYCDIEYKLYKHMLRFVNLGLIVIK
jgi:hypothetical protein